MTNTDHYFKLLDEYTGAYELVNHLDRTQQATPLIHAAGLATHRRLLELREQIEQAIQSLPGSDEQSSAEVAALKVAEDFDDVLRRILNDHQMYEEWERHERNVKSIVGRWRALFLAHVRVPTRGASERQAARDYAPGDGLSQKSSLCCACESAVEL